MLLLLLLLQASELICLLRVLRHGDLGGESWGGSHVLGLRRSRIENPIVGGERPVVVRVCVGVHVVVRGEARPWVRRVARWKLLGLHVLDLRLALLRLLLGLWWLW